MAIEQQRQACIVPSWEGDDRTDGQARNGGHYSPESKLPTWDDGVHASFHKGCGGIVVFGLDAWCPACDDESLGDADWEARVVARRTLGEPCWTAFCDGECGAEFEDDEGGYVVHFPGPAAAEERLREYGWVVQRDGRVFCDGDAPWDGSPRVAAVIPGQTPLFG